MEDPYQPHVHEPNPNPPTDDPTFSLIWPESKLELSPVDLHLLPKTIVSDCMIVTTSHGTSGPFAFGGTSLRTLIETFTPKIPREVVVVSVDNFGTRLSAEEIFAHADRPIILAYEIDRRPMDRAAGLVRLIVPPEIDDAMRQVKWVNKIQLSD
jgi:hypothetical protein